VVVSADEVTVSISWDDSRGTHTPGARETFTLTSRMEGTQ
jgi:type IV pilus assembly protein PilV